MEGRWALAVGGLHETSSRFCPKCGAEMDYLGQRIFGTQAYMEYGTLSALFHVYVCSRCLTVQLISYDNYAYQNLVKRVEARPTPKSFLKPCVSCGSSIPIASEECEFCGSKQPSWEEAKRGMQREGQALLQKLAEFEKKRIRRPVEEKGSVHPETTSSVESEATPKTEVRVKPGECMVCRSPVGRNGDVFTCPHCGNTAHRAHMLEWLHIKGTCPVCGKHVEHSSFGNV